MAPPQPVAVAGRGASADGMANGVKQEPGAEGIVKPEPGIKPEPGMGALAQGPVPGQQLPHHPQGPVVTNGAAAAPGQPGASGAPAASSGAGSSSQGRKSTLPVQALVHAFHCTDPGCQQKTCADTKAIAVSTAVVGTENV